MTPTSGSSSCHGSLICSCTRLCSLAQDVANQPASDFSRLAFSKSISQILLSVNIGDGADTSSTPFSHIVIGNAVRLLLQSRSWVAAVVDNGHVVCKHVSWPIQGTTQHPQLVSETLYKFNCCLHSRKLRSKRGSLNGSLLLTMEDNGSSVAEDQDTSS